MKKLSLSLIFLILSTVSVYASTPAHLVTTSTRFFVDSTTDFGGEVYYNCRDVEYRIEDMLAKMGAQDVDVRCTGGIDNFNPPIAWQSHVELSFKSLKTGPSDSPTSTVQAQWKPVDYWASGACYLHAQLFREVKGSFEMRNLEDPFHCFSSSSSFSVKFETLFQAR